MGKIKINGKEYETLKDQEGIERFKVNNLILKMKIHFDVKTSEMVKLVELEAITLMDLLDYYTGIGMSVCGVEELSFFEDFEFERCDGKN